MAERMQIPARPVMPGVGHGMGTAGRRVDSYLSVLAGPAPAEESGADAAQLMQQLTRRPPVVPSTGAVAADRHTAASRRKGFKGLSLFAPLRRLRRNLLGGRL